MIGRLTKFVRGFLDLRLLPQDMRQMTCSVRESVRAGQLTNRLLATAELDRLRSQPELQKHGRLERFGRKGYSQNDEDGIIEEIFRRIGTTDRSFVEFGTGNGLENNTVFLLKQGWKGLWLDGCSNHISQQHTVFQNEIASGQLRSHQAFLTIDNINQVIAEGGARAEIDLLSIDIDGNDYHLWKAIDVVSPRVVVIEFNAYAPPPIEWIMEYQADYVWDGKSSYFNSSLESLAKLGIEKGYRLVGCNLSGLNAFFVRDDLAGNHFASDYSALHLYHPRRWWVDAAFRTEMIPYNRPYTR